MTESRYLDLAPHIFGDALRPERRITVRPGPGLGSKPDPDVIRAYRRHA
jgi:L-alanine-DL-glutamate epimerase-like enolase superfamily enzyme